MLTHEMTALARGIATAADGRIAAMAKLTKSGHAEHAARQASMSRLRRTQRAELGAIRPGLAKRDATRAAGTRSALRAITADRAGAHAAWHDLITSLAGKRLAAASTARKATATPAAPSE